MAELEKVGVPWPPPKGWKKELANSGILPPDKRNEPIALQANFDGGCWPNPGGRATWGCVLRNSYGEVILEGSGVVGEGFGMSNNVAEYYAVHQALKCVEDIAAPGWRVLVCGDSRIVIDKLRAGKPSQGFCNSASITAIGLYKQLKAAGYKLECKWVPREENVAADALT